MRRTAIRDIPGTILLIVGAALALFTFFAAMLSIWQGPAFHGMLKAGLWGLAVYALAGGLTALLLTIRRAKTGRSYGA